MTTTGAVGEHYDSMIDYYELLFGAQVHFGYWPNPEDDGDFPGALLAMTDLVVGELDVRPGARVLDIGCGTGGPAVRLAERYPDVRVVGVTVSEQQVYRATARAQRTGVADRVEFHQADAMALPFDAESFDHAFALESIMHVPDRVGALEQATRVLRPGGRLVLTDVFRTADRGTADLVTGFAEANILTVLPDLSAYDTLVPAGLTVTAVRDITENSRRATFTNVVAAGRERHESLVATLGEESTELFYSMCTALAAAGNLGYLLLTLTRS
ncbi:SAM-dependent methyltransferase [Actinophytocola xanthii]|uniref:SAM-dependent methyltransferase n=1 Tax=Actinophytocola xanthii TaxID=1912961 RepID=UPI001178C49C|nr:class I SAM-dependent methyltransferase [Actinophytocola xanthii]